MSYTEYKVRVYKDGTEQWYNQNGKRHREDGPAVIEADGSQFWYKSGKLHREDGPAVVWADGHKSWYKNGWLHREDGPAIIDPSGHEEWHLNGIEYTEQEFFEKTTKKSDPCDGKTVEIDGKKYKLSLVE